MKHYVEPNDMALDSTPGILSTRLDEFHSVSWLVDALVFLPPP